MVSSSSLLLSSLELSDTKVYAPQIRALLGTASHFCEVVVLRLRARAADGVALDVLLQPLHHPRLHPRPRRLALSSLQGYLVQKKTPPPRSLL